MAIAKYLLINPHLGITEKDSYFEIHFLNARNEVNQIERELNIELERVREVSKAGRHYTRYLPRNSEQIQKIALLYNQKLKHQQNKYKRFLQHPYITTEDIQKSINLLGEKK